MSAQLTLNSSVSADGLRPIDPLRDLAQVADLIEEAFAGELEPSGRRSLQDMRALARMGPFTQWLARSDPYLHDVLGGFVWQADGRVVGNITLQRGDSYGGRWQIANVAVDRAWRGRGIGRTLMEAALARIEEQHGSWAVLQVRNDNPPALALYQHLGFQPLTEELTLQLDQVASSTSPAQPIPGLRAYHHSEWQARYVLEASGRSEFAQWWRPIRSHDYMQVTESRITEKLWELAGRNRVRRWVLDGAHGGLAAWLEVDARRWDGIHRIGITLHPALRGQMEALLLAHLLAFLHDYPRWPVRIEHSGEHPQLLEALSTAGFRVLRNHLAMRRKL